MFHQYTPGIREPQMVFCCWTVCQHLVSVNFFLQEKVNPVYI